MSLTLARVLEREPAWELLPSDVPPGLCSVGPWLLTQSSLSKARISRVRAGSASVLGSWRTRATPPHPRILDYAAVLAVPISSLEVLPGPL